MDSGVEHITDLGLVNYVQHPTNKNYVVFRFADEDRAKSFETELKKAKIWFEKSEDTPRTKTFYLFGVHKRDFNAVQDFNFNVEAQHRSFLIKNIFFRYFFLLIVGGTISLAILGYCTRQEKLAEKSNFIEQSK